MKINLKHILMLSVAVLGLVACEYDNYDAPSMKFSGQLLYKGQPFLFDGSSNRDPFVFYQKGFGKVDGGTSMHTTAQGTYSQLLFKDNDYWLTLRNNNYPFEIEEFPPLTAGYDSTFLHMTKDVQMDFHITPYYEISNVTATLNGIDIKADFDVKKVTGTRKEAPRIVKAYIYMGTNNYVNSKSQVVGSASVNVSGDGHISVSVGALNFRKAYPEYFSETAYYRVAIELENTPNYYLFSDRYAIEDVPFEFNDVTDQFLKNYKQPFKVTYVYPVPADGRRGILSDWIASNDNVKYTMYDGWGDRLFMCAENWGGANDLDGCIYQTFTLPKGKYVFVATRGWNWWDVENEGGVDHAYFAVARGSNGIGWKSPDIIASLDCGIPASRVSMPLNVEVTEDTVVSMGYVVHFPARERNALSFTAFTIYKAD